MKDQLRQFAIVASITAAIITNWLANALPINGQNTGAISYRFDVFFAPAGYVFSIWGVIYLGLVAFAIFQALPPQRKNPRLRGAGWWVVVNGFANMTWMFLWHYEQFALTLVVMLVLLVTLIMAYLRLEIGRHAVTAAEKWVVRLPFSIYLGWITIATVANATILLTYLNWDGLGLAPEAWMAIVLAAVLAIVALVNFTRRDIAYTAVILWALAGISVKHAAVTAVAVPTWITFGLVALTLAAAIILPSRGKMISTMTRRK